MSVQMRDGAMVAVVMRVPMTERKRGLNRAAQKIVDIAWNAACTEFFGRFRLAIGCQMQILTTGD
jgi:hypothetical protein